MADTVASLKLTSDGAMRLLQAAIAKAKEMKVPQCISVVDTGGEVISISTAMAGLLGPSRTRKIPLKVYGSSGWDRDAFLMPGLDLAFDRVRFDNFATVVLNLKAPSALLGVELGGIVGHRFLKSYRVGIDLETGRLRLSALPPASPSRRAG